ncbi:MAG: hypothetical protein R3B47_09570 [Bacteroidia bacterium]
MAAVISGFLPSAFPMLFRVNRLRCLPATTDYILLASGMPSGCSDRDIVRVNLHPEPVVTISPIHVEICIGDSIDLEANLPTLQESPGRWATA